MVQLGSLGQFPELTQETGVGCEVSAHNGAR